MSPERSTTFHIGERLVGGDAAPFVIAELGLNHAGSLGRAIELVDAAAAAGASAIKLQTIDAAQLVAPSCPPPAHVAVPSLAAFFESFELNEAAHVAVIARARAHGLAVMSTPFSLGAVDMLERIGLDAYKIASGDITFEPLVARCASTGRPLVISTGMSDLSEIAAALATARRRGASGIALLHCVSAYPTPEGSENLNAIVTLASRFGVPVGLSDHSPDTALAPAAFALGATVYERHLVLERGDGSIDEAVSSTPAELATLVRVARRTRRALGNGEKHCLPAERVNRFASRRALYAVHSLLAGAIVRAEDVIALRPADGLPPSRLDDLVGVTLTRDVAAGTAFHEADLPVRCAFGEHRHVA